MVSTASVDGDAHANQSMFFIAQSTALHTTDERNARWRRCLSPLDEASDAKAPSSSTLNRPKERLRSAKAMMGSLCSVSPSHLPTETMLTSAQSGSTSRPARLMRWVINCPIARRRGALTGFAGTDHLPGRSVILERVPGEYSCDYPTSEARLTGRTPLVEHTYLHSVARTRSTS